MNFDLPEKKEQDARSLRDDLELAFADSYEDGSDPDDGVVLAPVAAVDESDDEPEASAAAEKPVKAAKPAKQAKDDEGDPEPDTKLDPLADPPRGLSAAQREEWKNTPKAIREAMHKRSEDYSNGIAKYASMAKNGEAMTNVMRPYQQLFAMTGQNPPQLVGTLLQTAAILHSGAPSQKAQAIASIVKQYGVDINELDSALVGSAPPKNQQTDINTLVDERLRQMQANQQSAYQTQQNQQRGGEVAKEIQAFAQNPAHEFYEDVRGDMAEWMEMSSRSTNPAFKNMTLKQAYDKACENHPEISQILATRASTGSVNRKRKASSSVHGTRGGDGSVAAPAGTIRSALMHAIENAGRM